MFKDAQKNWQFKGRKRTEFIGLYKNTVHVIYSNNPDTSNIYSYEEFLLAEEVFGSLEIHYEIIREIVANEPDNLSAEALTIYQFYKCYHPDQEWTDSVLIPDTNFSATISAFGLMQFRQLPLEQVCVNTQCIHRFFLYGPNFSGIPLPMRIKWKEIIYESLNKTSEQFNNKGFILIDYNKIAEYNINSPDPLRDAATFVTLNKNGLTIGEWNGNQQNGSFYSLEACWYFGEKLLNNWSADTFLALKNILAAAIVTENSTLK